MQERNKTYPLSAVAESIEIPDSAYERAEKRYNDLGEWMGREESTVHDYDPEVFPQGSFLLGTVTRPSDEDDEYDLDLGVKLRKGVSKETHAQKELKSMVGKELRSYRKARGIEEDLDEKRRCWRLIYQDELSFHLDIVPCIPEDESRQSTIKEAMMAADTEERLADEVSELTVSITDTDQRGYASICSDWNVSNPQGYGHWFTSRVRQAKQAVLTMERRAEVLPLPTHKLKAPLQQCVQILKLHRDQMFEDDHDRAPISIIITTLAARAYEGQEQIDKALLHIVDTMEEHVSDSNPRVPNPVNPEEDFADKWYTDEGRELGLEDNFWRWLEQAKADFLQMAETRDAHDLEKYANSHLGVHLDPTKLREEYGLSTAASATSSTKSSRSERSKTHIQTPPKPWTTT